MAYVRGMYVASMDYAATSYVCSGYKCTVLRKAGFRVGHWTALFGTERHNKAL